MIQSLCLLQKYCVGEFRHSESAAQDIRKLLDFVENVENYVSALDIRGLGVYDRVKFEESVARWKFNWPQLSYHYEIIGKAGNSP